MQKTKQILVSEGIYIIKIDQINYKVYRLSQRKYRIEKESIFFFNIHAFSIEKVSEFLSRLDYNDNK